MRTISASTLDYFVLEVVNLVHSRHEVSLQLYNLSRVVTNFMNEAKFENPAVHFYLSKHVLKLINKVREGDMPIIQCFIRFQDLTYRLNLPLL